MWARFLFEFLIFIYRWNIQRNPPTVRDNTREENVWEAAHHVEAGAGEPREAPSEEFDSNVFFLPPAIAPVICLASSRHTCNAHTDSFIRDE